MNKQTYITPKSTEWRWMAAECIIRENDFFTHSGGYYVSLDSWKIRYVDKHNGFNPHPDDEEIMPLSLIAPDAMDTSSDIDDWEIEFDSEDISLSDILQGWAKEEKRKAEDLIQLYHENGEWTELKGYEYENPDGSLKDWVWGCIPDAISWARGNPSISPIIERMEADAKDRAIGFVFENILDEIELELED